MAEKCSKPESLMIDNVKYVREDSVSRPSAPDNEGRPLVLIRTVSAGVHIGRLVQSEGMNVVLCDARRLWAWKGAFTLNEVSQIGVSSGSRISAPVPEIKLTQAIEVLGPHCPWFY